MHRQPGSRHCFLCGTQNPRGLHLSFFEDEQGRVVVPCVVDEDYQGYPGVVHGGVVTALLDEAIGRTLTGRDIWAMTADLHVRFHQPVPTGEPITVVGDLVRLRSRLMEGRGEIRLADGTVAVTAEAKYIRLPDEEIAPFRDEIVQWEDATTGEG